MLIKLIKYDIIRKKNMLLTAAAVFILAELLLLFSLYKGGSWLVLFVVGSIFLFAGAFLFVVYDNIKLLSDDLNTKSGYMLFLTPNHGYNIVGSKMIVGFVDLVIATIFIIAAFYINYSVAVSLSNGGFAVIVSDMLREISIGFNQAGVNWFQYISAVAAFILEWFSFILTVYLAIVLRKTLLSTVKYKGMLSFIVFIVLNIATGTAMQGLAFVAITVGGYGDFITNPEFVNPDQIEGFINLVIGVSNGLNLVLIIGFFIACGFLITKRVDL